MFLKGIIFHEETRQRLAAEGARAWEEAIAQRLENAEKAVRIAKDVGQNEEIDRDILNTLLGLSESLPHGRLRLTAAESREET